MIVYQYDDGSRPAYKESMRQAASMIPGDIDRVTLYKTDVLSNCSDYRAISNILRCSLACAIPDMLWLDTDVLIDKWIDFTFIKDKAYFGTGMTGQPENWAFFVNGRCDFFIDMKKKFDKEKPSHIWWFSRYVQSHLHDVELIPAGYFTHIMMSRAVLAGEYFGESGNNRWNVKRTNNELALEVR